MRFRVKATPDDNYTELQRCMATGLPIQIKDAVDFINVDGTLRNINLDGVTLKFVGSGQIKNCQITGVVNIEAGRRKIFDNVYLHLWNANGVDFINKDSIYNIYLPNTNNDIF